MEIDNAKSSEFMDRLNIDKLHTTYTLADPNSLSLPRRYTLTHSDLTGEMFLSIGDNYNFDQISGLYDRLMRDEILAELNNSDCGLAYTLYCHVSGGFCFGTASMRYRIFKSELKLVLEAIRYGDRILLDKMPEVKSASVFVKFRSTKRKCDIIENWGKIDDYS